MTPSLSDAMELVGWGLTPLPLLPLSKIPAQRKGEVEGSRDEATIAGWFEKWGKINLGVCCGPEHGVVVIDFDSAIAEEIFTSRMGEMPQTPTVRTQRGKHYYFRSPEKVCPVKTIPDVDWKYTGFVVAPPSVRGCGFEYFWDWPPSDAPFAPLPEPFEIDLGQRLKARTERTYCRESSPLVSNPELLDKFQHEHRKWIIAKATSLVRWAVNRSRDGWARHDCAVALAMRLANNWVPRDLADCFMDDFKRAVTGDKSRPIGTTEMRNALDSAYQKSDFRAENDLKASIYHESWSGKNG
jgi:hypothetical protein